MLSQVTAKHPSLLLLQLHLPLLRFLWAGLHEGTKEAEELATLLWHCTTKGRNQFISGWAQWDQAERKHILQSASKRQEHCQHCILQGFEHLPKPSFSLPTQRDQAERHTFYRARKSGKNIANKYIQQRIFPVPGGLQGHVGWGPGQPGLVWHSKWRLAAQPEARGLELDDP